MHNTPVVVAESLWSQEYHHRLRGDDTCEHAEGGSLEGARLDSERDQNKAKVEDVEGIF